MTPGCTPGDNEVAWPSAGRRNASTSPESPTPACRSTTARQTPRAPPRSCSAAPRAELQRAIHYDAGPVWQHPDGSAVKGTVQKRIDRPGTIPELTLSAEQIGADHGLLACVDTIRRINTTGRLAPARPCTVGAVAEVPYTATYVFSGRSPAAPHVNSAPGK
jgi:hypothetical protein